MLITTAIPVAAKTVFFCCILQQILQHFAANHIASSNLQQTWYRNVFWGTKHNYIPLKTTSTHDCCYCSISCSKYCSILQQTWSRGGIWQKFLYQIFQWVLNTNTLSKMWFVTHGCSLYRFLLPFAAFAAFSSKSDCPKRCDSNLVYQCF